MFSCKDVTDRASDALEGRLTLRERLALQSHLVICIHCRRYLRQFAATVGLLRGLPPEAEEKAVPDGLLAAFRMAHGRARPDRG